MNISNEMHVRFSGGHATQNLKPNIFLRLHVTFLLFLPSGKLTWNPKNRCLVDVSPFPRGVFSGSMLFSRSVDDFQAHKKPPVVSPLLSLRLADNPDAHTGGRFTVADKKSESRFVWV